jgi:hypothetical protein
MMQPHIFARDRKLASLGDRPQINADVRELSGDNPLWDAPGNHGELIKLGLEVAQSSVSLLQGCNEKAIRTALTTMPAAIVPISRTALAAPSATSHASACQRLLADRCSTMAVAERLKRNDMDFLPWPADTAD